MPKVFKGKLPLYLEKNVISEVEVEIHETSRGLEAHVMLDAELNDYIYKMGMGEMGFSIIETVPRSAKKEKK